MFEIQSISRDQNKIGFSIKHRGNISPSFFRIDLIINGLTVTWWAKKISKILSANEEIPVSVDFSEFKHRKKILKFINDHKLSLNQSFEEDNCPIFICVSSFSQDAGIHKHQFPILFHEKNCSTWDEALFEYFDFNPHFQNYDQEFVDNKISVTPKPKDMSTRALPIAFYLPQFYPTRENDEWWGPGYTEWAGVVTNEPQFKSHVSPNIPADLGFYDTRVTETRRKQGDLAEEFGIFGFCYYFYWFSGRRILEAPLEQILRDKEPDLPFCLCWANETWSRRWDGSESEVLIAQKHDVKKDIEILNDLYPYFNDERYIRVDNKPVILIYRLSLMSDPIAFVKALRIKAENDGLPGVYICSVMSFGHTDGREFGCDASVEFPPHNVAAKEVYIKDIDVKSEFEGKIYDYKDLVSRAILRPDYNFPYFPGVMPRWDNSARRGSKANIFINSSPEDFAAWTADACNRTERLNPQNPFVFINSWNEWSEGAHLEPDRKFQRSYLEAVRIAKTERSLIESSSASSDHKIINSQFKLVEQEILFQRNNVIFSKIYEGYPLHLDRLMQIPGFKSHIDIINGQQFTTNFVIDRTSGFHIKGWAVGDVENDLRDVFGILLLKSMGGDVSYFIPTLNFTERKDVAEYYKLKSDSAQFGFEIRTARSDINEGVYLISFMQVESGRVFHHNTNSVVHVF